MGSTGSHNFTDYPGSSGGRPSSNGGGGGLSGGGGGSSSDCGLGIVGVKLEEVGLSDYFTAYKKAPPVGVSVRVRKKLVGGRIGVETVEKSEVIGVLPTNLNYVRQCLAQGWKYEGLVIASSSGRLPSVTVDLEAVK